MEEPKARSTIRSRHLQRNLSDRLQQSIQLLDSLTPSSNLSLKASKTPASRRSYVPHYVEQSPFDVSYFLNAQSSTITVDEVPQPQISTLNVTAVPDISLTTAKVLHEADPGESATAEIYHNFWEAKRSASSEIESFALLDKYIEACQDNITKLKVVISKLPIKEHKFNRAVQLKNLLQHELNTWGLVKSLYGDRLNDNSKHDSPMPLISGRDCKEFVDMLYENDSSLRESQLVVSWLEAVAFQELEDGNHLIYEYFAKKRVAWEGTLKTLQNNDAHNRNIECRPIVDELDPDVTLRQGKPLTDLDMEDEVHFLKSLFLCIRSGQLAQAQHLCESCGQFWRASTLEGWRLLHDPNYLNANHGSTVQPIEGNFFRDVWKTACWNMTLNDDLHLYERAIYAALCGNLKVLLTACCSWEEYLWAYFRVMIDNRVETEISNNMVRPQGLTDLPREYWEQVLTPEMIFNELKASTVEAVQKEGNEPYHVIQKFIILNDIKGLVEAIRDLLSVKRRNLDHLIRFVVHLVLFLIRIKQHTLEEASVALLEHYVEVLIEKKAITLVPGYIAFLPKSQQVYWCSLFMEGINNKNEQKMCLELAEEAGLDVPLITKTVVENVRKKQLALNELPDKDSKLQPTLTPEDEQKINSLNWLMFDPLQRTEALIQANALMRYFLLNKNLDAARVLFSKVPPDSIDLILKQQNVIMGAAVLTDVVASCTREYICYQTYFEAHSAVSDWFEHFHHGKPPKPDLPTAASFSERVAFEHKAKQYDSDLNRWHNTLNQQTMTTTGKLYNVLLFVDGGWLVDLYDCNKSMDEDRKKQLQKLREMYIPEVTMLLYSVLQATNQYKECFQLADVIAAEEHQLYKAFKKQDLLLLLDSLWKSSILLLDHNLDPLGYPLK